MDTKDYLKILREIKAVAFATVDDNGLPQARIIDIMLVDDVSLYFITARGKEFYRQLEAQKFVAITGMTQQEQALSLRGKVKKVDQSLLEKVFEENPFMKDIYPGDSRFALDVFCLYEGQGEYFDLSVRPIFRDSFTLGETQSQPKQHGFFITDQCNECGVCASVCPQQCIDEGTPYVIRQQNCLHCGLCEEECPVKAIVRTA